MLRTSYFIAIVILASTAAAFDFEEHKYLSNVALRIALRDPAVSQLACDIATPQASAECAEGGESFGDLVGLADYVVDPNRFFTGTNTMKDPPWPQLKKIKGNVFRWAQASHSNENHFQNLALIAHYNNHQMAVGEARRADWTRALLFEAYALHFIEDFLSPGHVATKRSGLPDFVAVGLHDRFGAKGLDFVLAKNPRLFDLATKIGSGEWPVDFRSQSKSQFKLEKKDFALLAAKVDPNATEQDRTLRLHGDSTLRDNRVQAAFITLLAVRSLLETLVLIPEENAFRDYQWSTNSVRILYGEYKIRWRTLTWYKPGEILIFGHENAYVPGRRGEEPEGRWGLLAETLVFSLPPVEFPLESKARRPYRYGRALSPAIVAGVSRTFGPQPTNAYYGRLIVTIPHTNLQFSTKGGVRQYEIRGGGSQTLPIVGFAFEGGFSFIFVRFGGEWERHEVAISGKRDRLYLSTGISGFVPGRFIAQKLRRRRSS
jgi:hypothetical protein